MGKDDFGALERMIYSGRGIVVGMTPSENSFIGYSLTGRSSSSQARELVDDGKGVIRTSVTDKKQLEKGNPALLLYPAIAYNTGRIVASNGAQTKLLYSQAKANPSLVNIFKAITDEPVFEYDSKEGWIDITSYEPDAPNFTPRICAALSEGSGAMCLVRRDLDFPRTKEVFTHSFELSPSRGKLITTYDGKNENPLASFVGEPLNVRIGSETADEIADSIYEAIFGGQNPGDNYRVAAAVMMLRTGGFELSIRNRSQLGR